MIALPLQPPGSLRGASLWLPVRRADLPPHRHERAPAAAAGAEAGRAGRPDERGPDAHQHPTIHYKGFRILPLPYQLADSKRWTVDFEIRRRGQCTPFSLGERYRTEREAEGRCVRLGRRIIDGKVAGCSVAHLRRRSLVSRRDVLMMAAAAILAMGTLMLRTDPLSDYPNLAPEARLMVRHGFYTAVHEMQVIGEWLFPRVVAVPKRDPRLE